MHAPGCQCTDCLVEQAGREGHVEVQYGKAKPGGDRCVDCKNFYGCSRPFSVHCELVVDPISPGGWCVRFEPK